MVIDSVRTLVDTLRDHGLLEPEQLSEVAQAAKGRFAEPRGLAAFLIQRDWLTPYQINQVFQGKGAELLLGPYRLLERLGQGGMGQVYKAKHMHMGRVVALKVIRKEKMAQPDAVRRFRREIKAAAQLTHPNIVIAFDADQVGEIHFFAMEYVDGVDLATLLKQLGPLPVELACRYVRQIAEGLQHAHERGLVHRDIKPANLLVTGGRQMLAGGGWPAIAAQLQPPSMVKILDMGLARADLPDDADSASQLTKQGRVVGTPDYMAPEQATNPSTSDIRADLYSLGCTFYQMLTGLVPYPGGTTMEKLLKHRLDPAPAVERLRPDTPPVVVEIIRALLAKEPAQRYQTPAQLLQALHVQAVVAQAVAAPMAAPLDETPVNLWAPETTFDEDAEPFAPGPRRQYRSRKPRADLRRRRRRSSPNQVLWITAGVFMLVGLLVFLAIMFLRSR